MLSSKETVSGALWNEESNADFVANLVLRTKLPPVNLKHLLLFSSQSCAEPRLFKLLWDFVTLTDVLLRNVHSGQVPHFNTKVKGFCVRSTPFKMTFGAGI